MNKELISKAFEKYNNLMIPRREFEKIKNSIRLSNISDEDKINSIKRIEQDERRFPSEEEILRYSFYSFQDESICNIYLFMGGYYIDSSGEIVLASENQKINFYIYQNLEKDFPSNVVYPEDRVNFEKDNVVLKFKNFICTKENFYKIQYIYFKELINNKELDEKEIVETIKSHL